MFYQRTFIAGMIIVSLGLTLLFLTSKEINLAAPSPQLSSNVEDDIEPYISPFKTKPPFAVKAIYLTPYTVASKYFDGLLSWVDKTELNAMVIDIKDATGTVYYPSSVPLAQKINATKPMLNLRELVKKLHQNEVYAIARLVVFQDPILANTHPEWSVQIKSGDVWKDNKGLSWLDPASEPVWEYNFAIAEEAIKAGFDEINFDYIRFPSDGDLDSAVFPVWQEKTTKVEAMRRFFEALHTRLSSQAKLSADLFGLTFYDYGDLNIGQRLEEAAGYFDYLSPMVYPSHYAKGVFGFENPALHPYEVVRLTLARGSERISSLSAQLLDASSTPSALVNRLRVLHPDGKLAQVRPWLQDFDLGVVYTKSMVRSEIQAVIEVDSFGYMLWDPSNEYTRNLFSN